MKRIGVVGKIVNGKLVEVKLAFPVGHEQAWEKAAAFQDRYGTLDAWMKSIAGLKTPKGEA